VAAAVVPTAVAGQPDSPQPTTTAGNSSQAQDGTRIDADLRLVSASYDGSGTAVLTFQTDAAKAITLTDAGGFVDGGHLNRRTVVLDGQGTHTVEFAVTESRRGYVGVTIATDQTLYAEVIRSPTPSPFAGASGTTGWLGGASIVLVSFVGSALWVVRNEGGEPVEAEP
jgi:hypothetical protein